MSAEARETVNSIINFLEHRGVNTSLHYFITPVLQFLV